MAALPAAHSAPNSPPPIATSEEAFPLDWIEASPLNPRKTFAAEDLDALAASIAAQGLLEPLVIREVPVEGDVMSYHLVAGERRLRACRSLGLTTVPVRIYRDLTEPQILLMMMAENLARADLNAIEEADGFARLQEEANLTQREIAAQLGKSQPYVANTLRLRKLPVVVQDLVRAGALGKNHAISLASYAAWPDLCLHLAALAVQEGLSQKQIASKTFVYDRRHFFIAKGLVAELTQSATKFDWGTICRGACPFDAFRAAGFDWLGICLQPAHAAQLTAEHEAAEEAKAAAKLAALAEQIEAGKVVNLSAMGWSDYTRIGATPPAGCTDACKCRATGVYEATGDQATVCVNPKRYSSLSGAATREQNKRAKARTQTLSARLESRVQEVAAPTSRELALLVFRAIEWNSVRSAALDAQLAALGVTLPGVGWYDFSKSADALDQLAALRPEDLVRLGVEITLRRELADGQKTEKRWTEWYLSNKRPR